MNLILTIRTINRLSPRHMRTWTHSAITMRNLLIDWRSIMISSRGKGWGCEIMDSLQASRYPMCRSPETLPMTCHTIPAPRYPKPLLLRWKITMRLNRIWWVINKKKSHITNMTWKMMINRRKTLNLSPHRLVTISVQYRQCITTTIPRFHRKITSVRLVKYLHRY